MPSYLRNIRLTRVDLVDAGANFDPETEDGAHVLLVKRAPQEVTMKATQREQAEADALAPVRPRLREARDESAVRKKYDLEPETPAEIVYQATVGRWAQELMKRDPSLTAAQARVRVLKTPRGGAAFGLYCSAKGRTLEEFAKMLGD